VSGRGGPIQGPPGDQGAYLFDHTENGRVIGDEVNCPLRFVFFSVSVSSFHGLQPFSYLARRSSVTYSVPHLRGGCLRVVLFTKGRGRKLLKQD